MDLFNSVFDEGVIDLDDVTGEKKMDFTNSVFNKGIIMYDIACQYRRGVEMKGQ